MKMDNYGMNFGIIECDANLIAQELLDKYLPANTIKEIFNNKRKDLTRFVEFFLEYLNEHKFCLDYTGLRRLIMGHLCSGTSEQINERLIERNSKQNDITFCFESKNKKGENIHYYYFNVYYI